MQVVIVDDDRLSRRILEDKCLEWGFEVLSVQDGQQAWELYIQEDVPRIFLIDWVMPGLSGVELCERMRQSPQTGYSYIIIITSYKGSEHVVRGLEAGADDYITKPFNNHELRCRLNIGKRILELEDNILRMANIDYLTGVYNRRYFLQRLQCELSRCRRANQQLGLLLLDIDDFKKVNDTFGHVVGDQVLTGLANILKRSCRDYDLVGRYGGEEFIICLPGANQEETLNIAERIRQAVSKQTISCRENTIQLTISIGYLAANGGDYQELITALDEALYTAKRTEKNKSVAAVIKYNPQFFPTADCYN